MDFLKSTLAAYARGPAFGYAFGDRVDLDQSIWTLHNGNRREDGSKCSIFSFEIAADRSRLALARNALRKFRTLRHPGIIKVLDTIETDHLIWIATEHVTPLTWSTKRKALSAESLKWGLHGVAKTLKFINDEATSVHGNVRASSVFTSESGEWKLGGLEILSSMKEDDAVIFTQGSLVRDIGRYSPPEVIKNGWSSVRSNPVHAVDAYGYGILVTEAFSGSFSGSDQIGSTKNVPPEIQTNYKRLTHAVPKMRLSVAHFLEQGSRNGSFFDTPLIQLTDGIENLGLKDAAEKDAFLNKLEEVVESDDFPEELFKIKMLPELLKSIEFGGGGPKSFALVMRIATKLSEDEYESQVTPAVVRLFASPDRALRVCLLENLPSMIDRLSQKIVTDKIFPQMVTGFGDLAPVVREQTVKAVLVVVPKLSDRVINGELLRHLAKTAIDEQPGIRTNTTICLGKIARNLGSGSRTKVLSAAFLRALRDPFVHARNAALMALAATADMFSEDECASKMLPAICPSLVDKEKMIRDQANKTLNIYLDRVRKYSASLPDTSTPLETTSTPGTTAGPSQPGAQWMGWAISSFGKLGTASGDIQPNSSGIKPTPMERSSSMPPTNGNLVRPHLLAPSASPTPLVRKAPSALSNSSSAFDQRAEAEDFGAGWGADDDDAAGADADDADDAVEAWNDAIEFPASSLSAASQHATKPSSPSTPYDDGGEPDFEGWLNSQAATKQQSKKPLPKGLARKSAGAPTPALAAASSRPLSGTGKKSSPAAAPSPAKKVTPAVDADEEDWGENWG